MEAVLGIVILGAWLALIVLNALKRKWWFMGFAILGSPWSIIGAARLAKPDSWWCRERYEDDKRARVNERYSELFTY